MCAWSDRSFGIFRLEIIRNLLLVFLPVCRIFQGTHLNGCSQGTCCQTELKLRLESWCHKNQRCEVLGTQRQPENPIATSKYLPEVEQQRKSYGAATPTIRSRVSSLAHSRNRSHTLDLTIFLDCPSCASNIVAQVWAMRSATRPITVTEFCSK